MLGMSWKFYVNKTITMCSLYVIQSNVCFIRAGFNTLQKAFYSVIFKDVQYEQVNLNIFSSACVYMYVTLPCGVVWAWSPWLSRTCRARSSVCLSSWSTAAGRTDGQTANSQCSDRVLSADSHHPPHSDKSYSLFTEREGETLGHPPKTTAKQYEQPHTYITGIL